MMIRSWSELVDFWSVVRKEWRQRARKHRRAQRLYHVALTYNKVHSYGTIEKLWMCPTCNKVHEHCKDTDGLNLVLTGEEWPECCEFKRGHRLYKECAAGYNI